MYLHNVLDQYNSNCALVTENSEYKSYQDLLALADHIGKKIQKRSLIFVFCRNSYESIAGYIGIMRTNSVSILISETISKNYINQLLLLYLQGLLI